VKRAEILVPRADKASEQCFRKGGWVDVSRVL
jgi:hypothetical protein